MQIEFRLIKSEDFDFLWRLHNVTLKNYVTKTWGWNEIWQKENFICEFNTQNGEIILINGADAGYFWVIEKPEEVLLASIRLLPDFQNKGAGTKIIQSLLNQTAKPICLKVLKINPARALYERLGFETSGQTETHFLMKNFGNNAIVQATTESIKTMKEKIVELLPEINLIKDESLREKTVQVWEDAVREGGWTWDAIERMPFSVHVENCSITFIEHVRTVCKMCVAVADVLKESYGERSQINYDTLIAGALLADVGKLIEYEEKDGQITRAGRGQHLRHPFTGVAMSHFRGVPPEVQHVIATHSKEGEMMVRSNESVIFHHADFIDFDLVSKKRPF